MTHSAHDYPPLHPQPERKPTIVEELKKPVSNTKRTKADKGVPPHTAPGTPAGMANGGVGVDPMLDPRPKVRLPGDNHHSYETAAALGEHLAEQPLFIRNKEIVTLEGGELSIVSSQTFRTLIERYALCYRKRKTGDNIFNVGVTMTNDEAVSIMASPYFKEKLRCVQRLNTCRLPVLRDDGQIELLPEGYDAASQTLTISTAVYADDMALDEAIAVIDDLYREFVFDDDGHNDGERSKAVAVSALLGLYAAQLLPKGSLRPCFVADKNAEGAGASTLIACTVVPMLGRLPTGTAPKDESEMRKVLLTAVREAQTVIVFDNQKTRLSSAALEGFISGPEWRDRLLGLNQTFTGPNLATVFVSANGATFSPDMRRRSLVVKLHLAAERAEDRLFRRPLNLATLTAMRPQILSACWALVGNWAEKGCPQPRRLHSAFPEWAAIIGGIVEVAGYGCALETAEVAVAADEDGDSIRALADAMVLGTRYTFAQVVELCRVNECFAAVVGDVAADMGKANRTTLSRILARYDRRRVGDYWFVIDGKGHQRRYRIATVDQQQNSQSPPPSGSGWEVVADEPDLFSGVEMPSYEKEGLK